MNSQAMNNDFVHATALTIAGSDPSGGAGLQADLKTFQQFGVYGMSVVTLLTVQNTQTVSDIQFLAPDFVQAQFAAVVNDIPPKAIKLGALGTRTMVETVANMLEGIPCPVVIDPVLVSKHGHSLVAEDAIEAFRNSLIQRAWIVTPNRFEAECLTGCLLTGESDVQEATRSLHDMGAQHVLIKLGLVEGEMLHAFSSFGKLEYIRSKHSQHSNTHGSGCVLAAAIAASIACGTVDPLEAVRFAIRQVQQAIACGTQLGKGIHPVDTRKMSR